MNSAPVNFTIPQRLVAVAYGVVCHALYGVSVGLMMWSLFHGLSNGHGPFHGTSAVTANLGLLLLFPVSHSWLLSEEGRRLTGKLAPLGLGRDLGTTTFAIIAALQLIALFELWSPSGLVWWEAHGAARWIIAGLAVGAWLFLGKAIADSDPRLQTGFLGWWSVARNRKPDYRPFSTSGTYRHIRQPIYLAFALSLWAAAVWTPDQLSLAVLWTGYCVVGAAIKERRFSLYFGDAFRAYREKVPFFLPRLFQRTKAMTPTAAVDNADVDFDVIVAGGGPVGLLLANDLGARGIRVLVAEKRTAPPASSMAIGITPPSMDILGRLGLVDAFLRRGVRISRAYVAENGHRLGHVDFSGINAQHRYILSLPQIDTVTLLRRGIRRFDSVQYWQGMEVAAIDQDNLGATVRLRDLGTGMDRVVRTRYVIGADGHRSVVRKLAGIGVRTKTYRPRFLMADFEDDTALGDEAHLFFNAAGSVESFPLPGGKRRWIVMVTHRTVDQPGRYIVHQVRDLAGIDLSRAARGPHSAFQPRRMIVDKYRSNRVVLCGDAAHVMSPIGGQGMNTGFADAELLAEVLARVLHDPSEADTAFAFYEKVRRRAFEVSAGRAARGMWLGTRRGPVWSALRAGFIRGYLFRPDVKERVAAFYAMLTVPFYNMSQTPWPARRLGS
jgi:2-polyprenyl-6-methoxyphenol hydroxylase-like FAD-dependent oxidoreductase/protein-S-isoprenylcysteine O-methyltransferase Ste14